MTMNSRLHSVWGRVRPGKTVKNNVEEEEQVREEGKEKEVEEEVQQPE